MLEARNISKSFRGRRAVREVSFEVAEGTISALIGPNGAGKTTIFNMVAGVYAPDTGSILFETRPIHGLRPDRICWWASAARSRSSSPSPGSRSSTT
jgi:ABC-type branched-subunit amino acid transport system ATPase component